MSPQDAPEPWLPPSIGNSLVPTTWVCRTLEETQALAQNLTLALKAGMTLGLSGNLGAGKTTFVRALAHSMGVVHAEEVTSPTYALMHVYETHAPPKLVHLDLYRLRDPSAAIALGLDQELAQPGAVTVVEWAELMEMLLPKATVWLRIEALENEARSFTFYAPSAGVTA